MLDVTVKTLDGKNRSFSVPDDILVRDFKIKIASSVEITADTQRLIFQGRVLQDDKRLNEYDVNGKTLHIVQRPPPLATPTTSTAGRSTAAPPPSSTSVNGGRRTVSGQVSASTNVVVGSLGLPHDAIDPTQVQNAVQQALSASGIVGPGQNVMVQTRVSGDGSSVDVRINLGPATIESESQNRLSMVRRMLDGALQALGRLENPDADTVNAAPMDVSPGGERPTTTARVGSPMDTSSTPPPGGSTASATTTPASGNATGSATTQPPGGSTEGSATPEDNPNGRPTESAGTGVSDQARPQHPAPPALADLLSVVFDVNRRLQPYLDSFRDLLQRDPPFTAEEGSEMRARQTASDRVAEVLHYISHAYHNISDVMLNLAQPPPRQLRAAPVAMMPAGAFMPHMPPQAHVNVLRPGQVPVSSDSASTAMPRSTTSSSNSGASTVGVDSTTQTAGPHPPPTSGGQPHQGPRAPHPMNMPTNGQPYVFMEVGPQSVSISSVTSHVVTDGPTPTTQSTAGTTTSNIPTGVTTNPERTNTTQSNRTAQPNVRAMPRLPTTLSGIMGNMPPPPGLSGIMSGMPSFMPPDLLQNIIHMATNAAVQNHAGHGGHHVIIVTQEGDTSPTQTFSTHTSSSSTSMSSTSATTTVVQADTPTPSSSTTAAPSSSGTTTTTSSSSREPHRATLLIPGPPGAHGMFRPPGAELFEPVDPYLPCHSRFFVGRRQPEGANSTPEGVSGVVSNLLNSVLSQHQHAHAMTHHPHHHHQPQQQQQSGGPTPTARPEQAGHVPPPSQATNPFASLLQSIIRQPIPGNAVPRMPGTGPFRVQFQNVQQPAPPASNSTNQSTGQGTAPQRPQVPGRGNTVMSDEIFGQLVQGIGSHLSQAASGQQSSETIADFLHNLGQGYNIAAGEGMLSDLFMNVSQHLTFIDLMSVFFGNPQPLQSLRTPLQQFIREHVLHGNQPTVENIDQAVARILEEMREDISATCADVTSRDDIDFNMTLTRFLRQQLTITIRMIVNVPGDDQHFGRDIYERLRRVIHEFVVLSQYCLQGGTEAVERMVQSRLAIISSDVTPMIQQWMTGMTLQQLRQLLPSITIGPNDIMHYVVQRTAVSSEPKQAANTSASTTVQQDSSAQVNVEVTATSCQTEAMETDIQTAAMSVTTDEQEEPLGEDLEPEEEVRPPKPNIPREVLDCLPPPPMKESDDVAVVLGSEDWHRAVPAEWVPVITQDVQHQARQSRPTHQAGFSEAYITGMPAKRRKMMSQDGGDGMNSNDSNSTNSTSNTNTR